MHQAHRNPRSVVNHDGAALLDIDRGTITTLNGTGAFVWQELGKGRTEEDIIAALVERTGEAIATVRGDVREFVAALSSHNLVPRKEDRTCIP